MIGFCKGLGLLLLGLANVPIAEESAPSFEAIEIRHETRSLATTRILLPSDFDPQQTYPLLLAFHGFGGSAPGFERIGERFSAEGFIVALPQGVYPVQLGDTVGYDWFLHQPPTVREFDEVRLRALNLVAEGQVRDLLAELRSRYQTAATFVLGFSQGGIVAYLSALANHSEIEGAVIFGSLLDPRWTTGAALDAAKELRVLILQGSKDELVPPFEAEATRDLFVRHGYDVTYTTYDGGHEVPLGKLPAVVEWMQAER